MLNTGKVSQHVVDRTGLLMWEPEVEHTIDPRPLAQNLEPAIKLLLSAEERKRRRELAHQVWDGQARVLSVQRSNSSPAQGSLTRGRGCTPPSSRPRPRIKR